MQTFTRTLPGFKKAKKKRILNANKPFLSSMTAIYILYSLTFILPLIWLVINSLKGSVEFIDNPIGLSSDPQWSNYSTMFTDFNLPVMFKNTLLMCFIIPTVGLFFTNGVAYVCAVYDFPLKKFCYFFSILSIYISVAGSLPVTYKLMANLGLLDSLFGLIVMGSGGLNFQFLLLLGIYSKIPRDYKEAASIDGAGPWRTYFKIYLPQSLSTNGSLWVLAFIGQWNNFTSPYLFWNSGKTLATGIKEISDNIESGSSTYAMQYPKLFAAMLLTIVPVLLIFIGFQVFKGRKKQTESGGVKG